MVSNIHTSSPGVIITEILTRYPIVNVLDEACGEFKENPANQTAVSFYNQGISAPASTGITKRFVPIVGVGRTQPTPPPISIHSPSSLNPHHPGKRYDTQKAKTGPCDCGAAKTGGNHSDWCSTQVKS